MKRSGGDWVALKVERSGRDASGDDNGNHRGRGRDDNSGDDNRGRGGDDNKKADDKKAGKDDKKAAEKKIEESGKKLKDKFKGAEKCKDKLAALKDLREMF